MLGTIQGRSPALTPAPEWGQKLKNMVGLLHWDGSQTIAYVGVNEVLATAIVDTGACKTILDTEMAKGLGLKIRYAQDGDCGKYAVPGTGCTNEYAGVVDEPVVV